MIIHENILTAEQFCLLQESVGFGKPDLKQSEICLRNSLYSLSVEIDNKIVGMGRIVGDGARNFYIQDINIHPDYQGQGIGKAIVKKLLLYIKSYTDELGLQNCRLQIGLMAAKGKESFYEPFGFIRRPNDSQGNGMTLIIQK